MMDDMKEDAQDACQWAPFEYPKRCGRTKDQHIGQRHVYSPPPQQPEDHEIAYASAVTSWRCPFCGADNDVHGDGALGSWMECTANCGKYAYLLSEYDEPRHSPHVPDATPGVVAHIQEAFTRSLCHAECERVEWEQAVARGEV